MDIIIVMICSLATIIAMVYTPYILMIHLRCAINDRGYCLSWCDVFNAISICVVIQMHLHGVSIIQLYSGWH